MPLNHTSLIKSLCLISFFVIFSCKDGKKEEDSKDVAEKFNKAKFKDSEEAKFMVNAAEISYEEVELARLAESNGGNENIKEIGRMMQKNHSQFLTELKELALKKQITLPETTTKEGQNARTRLADKTGSDFDKQYCDMVVDNHKEAIKKFTNATEDCEDVEVKNWAITTLSMLRSHLDYAMTCKEAYKNNATPDARAFKRDTLKAMEKHRDKENSIESQKNQNTKENKTDAKSDVKKKSDKDNKDKQETSK
ncbi:MAG: hypothetical protein K0S12_224 [Bacteroidetes bacterium]|jgi:putative membrane protein|nr:hypothetical protein [Bacteroidota bacterium]